MHKNNKHIKYGFTIVELSIVIVIIGILAAITIVSYNGFTQRAAEVSLKSDLKNASAHLAYDQIKKGKYPLTTELTIDGIGLPKSQNTLYQYQSSGTDYCLVATSTINGTHTFHINSDSEEILDGVCTITLDPALMWKQISVGDNAYACGVTVNETGYCWGVKFNSGRIGDDTFTSRAVPTPIFIGGALSGKTIKSIATGYQHTCAIASDNKAYCWGKNTYGQLGDNSTSDRNSPVAAASTGLLSGKTIKSITLGEYHTCVIASDDKAYCWGYNYDSRLGNNSTGSISLTPVAVSTTGVLNGLTVKSISSNDSTTCVIASNNKVYCWGGNNNGQLGNNSTIRGNVPVAVDDSGVLNGKTIKSISNGGSYNCVIASDNKAYCWGYGSSGRLGNNDTVNKLTPVAVDDTQALNGLTIKSISAGSSSSCVIASNNRAYCWGNNYDGKLGNNSNTSSLTPIEVDSTGLLNELNVKSISSGDSSACVIASDNKAYCWGDRVAGYYDSTGVLGNNMIGGSLVPVMVSPIGTIGIDISAI